MPTDLVNEWIKLYDSTLSKDGFEEEDFRSLCLGWCLAKGLTVEEADAFYSARIKDGHF